MSIWTGFEPETFQSGITCSTISATVLQLLHWIHYVMVLTTRKIVIVKVIVILKVKNNLTHILFEFKL